MNKTKILATAIFSISATISQASFAERGPKQQRLVESGTIVGTTAAATAAAGPIGFVVGALGGAYLAKQTRIANNSEIELQTQQAQLNQFEHTLTLQEEEITQLETTLIEKLTFQVLFATGDDQLNELDKRRVRILAYYLEQNPNMLVSLHGHADPRGSDEYNNVLSSERANAIKKELISMGIDESRIDSKGFGTQFSNATKGDYDSYEQERRVDIVIAQGEIETETENPQLVNTAQQ